MTDEQNPQPQPSLSDPVKVALIGASATILVALISGFFALMGRQPAAAPPTSTATATVQATATVAPATVAPTAATQVEPTSNAPLSAPLTISIAGFLFASQITPDGIALDPGLSFPPETNTIYAVFRPDRTPPGIQVSHRAASAQNYYAFLETSGEKAPPSIGWQWFYQDKLVNEYETEIGSGYFWLSVHALNNQGLFEGVLGEAGVYQVLITVAQNPVLQSKIQVTP